MFPISARSPYSSKSFPESFAIAFVNLCSLSNVGQRMETLVKPRHWISSDPLVILAASISLSWQGQESLREMREEALPLAFRSTSFELEDTDEVVVLLLNTGQIG